MPLEDFLVHEFTIQRATQTKSNAGVVTLAYANVSTGNRGLIELMSQRFAWLPDGGRSYGSWSLICETSVDIRPNDRVIASQGAFEVVTVDNVFGHHIEATMDGLAS